MRFLCYVFFIVSCVNHSNANADLVTVSIDFEYPFDSGQFIVTGNAQFTIDNSVSVAGKAVDSISFTSPEGQFQTNDVFLDFRQGDDTNFPNNQYEFEIYHSSFQVFSNQPGDFLLQAATFSLDAGDIYGSQSIADNFLYFNGGTFDTSQEGIHHVTVTQAVPEPAFTGMLGVGMMGICFTRRRRYTTK